MKGALDRLLEVLLAGDPYFASYWQGLDRKGKRDTQQLLAEVERMGPADADDLLTAHTEASSLLRHYFACVPHKDMDYGRRPRDWSAFAADAQAQLLVFETSQAILQTFCRCLPLRPRPRLYGSIKPLSSLDRKVAQPAGAAGPRRLLDTWDIVRFRLVADGLPGVKATASALWECFLDNIVRCTNFYLSPPRTDHWYRAIHFEIEIQAHRWIEVQVLSRTRDVLGRLDYAPLFKKSVVLPDAVMLDWLVAMSLRGNLRDAMQVPELPFGSVWAEVPLPSE